MKLTPKIIYLSQKYKTPFLLVDLNKLKENYNHIKKSFPEIEIFYAMKANNHPRIIESLVKEGASFEIASENELDLLLENNVKPEKILCFNSIKTPEFLKKMHKNNIKIMAYDSFDELDKIAKYAPDSQVVLRIVVDNEGSEWPLTKKFGVDAAEAIPLIKYAKSKKLNPIGLTFHVGSQCLNKNNWANALYTCETVWKLAEKENIYFTFISLGGGLPISHKKPIPDFSEINTSIMSALRQNFKPKSGLLRVTMEPGRGLIGDTAIMVTSVIGKAKRGYENWVYIDAGVFNGFMETIENFEYEIVTAKNEKGKLTTIGGPSCDSVDIPFKNIYLPDVTLEEKVYIINAGAYTTVYASNFNGFPIPESHFIY